MDWQENADQVWADDFPLQPEPKGKREPFFNTNDILLIVIIALMCMVIIGVLIGLGLVL